MRIDPSTPVVVGVGQVTNRPGEGDPGDRPEPVALMVAAVEAAMEDCDGAASGASAGAGRFLLDRLGSLRIVDPTSWAYADVGTLLADVLDVAPPEVLVATARGNHPQALIHATALAIGRGDLDVAVLVGADCHYTQAAARRHGDRPLLPWTVQAQDVLPPTRFGTDQARTTVAEEERGLDGPITVFPLFEHALRSHGGRTLAAHQAAMGALWSQASEVAADNRYAWFQKVFGAEEVTTAAEGNRMVAAPYTKLLMADVDVDQGAAIVMCSAATAQAAGVDRERWVFPQSGADADDHWFLSHRADFHSSPAIRLAGGAALDLAGLGIDDITHVDLYSCAPAAVEIAATELGLACGDRRRPLTVTGGMTFAGSPGANYGLHATAAMVEALRATPGSLGLVTGAGGYLSSHSIGVYGTSPAPSLDDAAVDSLVEHGTVVERAGGFSWASPQAAVSALPQCAGDLDAEGPVVIETYSVPYARTGQPERAVVACRTTEGRRAWGQVTDSDQLDDLVATEGCGRAAILRPDGLIELA